MPPTRRTRRAGGTDSSYSNPTTPSSTSSGGAIAVLVLFALAGAVGVYDGVNRTVDLWVARRYRPMVSAAWNLAVLLASLSAIVARLRRLR